MEKKKLSTWTPTLIHCGRNPNPPTSTNFLAELEKIYFSTNSPGVSPKLGKHKKTDFVDGSPLFNLDGKIAPSSPPSSHALSAEIQGSSPPLFRRVATSAGLGSPQSEIHVAQR